jgi:hypothetical protein
MSRLAKFSLLVIAVFAAIGGFLFWLADPLYLKAPTDEQLSRVFQTKRAAFEQLRQMAIEDSITYVSASDLDSRLSDDRKREYANRLSAINSGLIVTTDAQTVRFIFVVGGLSAIGSEWLKGIEYLPGGTDRAGVVVESLDRPDSLATGQVYLRQIDGDWYLFLQKTD